VLVGELHVSGHLALATTHSVVLPGLTHIVLPGFTHIVLAGVVHSNLKIDFNLFEVWIPI